MSTHHEAPIIGGRRIPWLPDFLKLVFARKVFRSNSSFSVWSSWIGDVDVYAPVLHEYSPGKEIDFEFVRGNDFAFIEDLYYNNTISQKYISISRCKAFLHSESEYLIKDVI